MKHPSLKNVALILVAALLIGAAFFVAEYRNKSDEKLVYNASLIGTTTPVLSPELQNLDSDSDGLKDWEEVVLGTDPHKADTDGDGTADGKEVTLGRNPLVKGPNDKASQTSVSKSGTGEELTPTDLFARDFFARYMQLRQAGLSNDAASQNELVQQVLKNGVVLSTPKPYTMANIRVKGIADKASVEKYGNDVGQIFLTYTLNSKNEAVIAKDSLDKDDPKILEQIDPIITSYKNIINALLKTEVPQGIADAHLNLINAMNGVLFTAQSFRKSATDSLAGIQATAEYLSTSRNLSNSFNAIRNYLGAFSVTYKKGQGGSFFISTQ